MSEHTPVPWYPSEKRIAIKGRTRSGYTGVAVATTAPQNTDETRRADVERIIACVNACEGISNEALEGGLVFQLVTVAKDALRVIEDEYGYDNEQDDTQGRLRLLIAKAEGGGAMSETRFTGRREKVIDDVMTERQKQDAKWGEQNHSDVWWGAILGEEAGEVSQAVLHDQFGGKEAGTVRGELVQLAAVAVAWIECVDRNADGSTRSEDLL